MSAHAGKTAVRAMTACAGTPIGYRAVLAALQSEEARAVALAAYRAAGYTPDHFATRPAARRAMADALTEAEDFLELRGVRVEREAIRCVRRRLEAEVWP